MQTTTHENLTNGRTILVLDAEGRLFEVSARALEGHEVDPSRIQELARMLPRRPDGTVDLPSWIDLSGLEAEVEAQGRATNFAGAVLLALAGCAGPTGSVRFEQDRDSIQCVAIDMVDEELAGVSQEDNCVEVFDVELPAGPHRIRVRAEDGLVFDGRIYVKPNETERIRVDVGTTIPSPNWTPNVPGTPNGQGNDGSPNGGGDVVVENGSVLVNAIDHAGPAPGAVTISTIDSQVVARGTTGAPIVVPAGVYLATVRLEGTADFAEQTQRVDVGPGHVRAVSSQFPTGILEVRVRSDREPVFATVFLVRDGQEVGTMGSAVPWKVSAGTYDLRVVTAGDRGQNRLVQDVSLEPGQRLAVNVDL
jgi:hypothetical protein